MVRTTRTSSNSPTTFDGTVLGEGKQTSVGIFAEASLKPWEKVEILGSLRYDNFRNSDGRIVTNGITEKFSDRTFNLVSPRIAARYQFSEPLAVRAAYYGGFRAPTLAELYRSFETPTFRGLSNPNLKVERLWGGDVGFDFQRGKFSGQLNGFYNRLKDFVGSEEVGSSPANLPPGPAMSPRSTVVEWRSSAVFGRPTNYR